MFACIFSDVTGDTDTTSILYVWDSTVSVFSDIPVQQLVTRGAKQALTFVTDNSLYLVVANSYDSSQLTGDTSSTLYQWSAVTIQANDYPHRLITFSISSRSVTVDEPGTGNITSVSLTIIREYGLIGMLYSMH